MSNLNLVADIVNYTISEPRRAVIISANLTNPSTSLIATVSFVEKSEAYIKAKILPFSNAYQTWKIINAEDLIAIIKELGSEPLLKEIAKVDFTKPLYCIVAWIPYREQ